MSPHRCDDVLSGIANLDLSGLATLRKAVAARTRGTWVSSSSHWAGGEPFSLAAARSQGRLEVWLRFGWLLAEADWFA